MRIFDILSALLRFIASLLIVSLVYSLTLLMSPDGMPGGLRTVSLIVAAATGLTGALVWNFHRELASWLLLTNSGPMVQGVRMASFIATIGLFAQTLGGSVYWGLISPDDGAYGGSLMGGRGNTAADITMLIIAITLLFLSPHIENYIDELRVRSLIKAEIDAKGDSTV